MSRLAPASILASAVFLTGLIGAPALAGDRTPEAQPAPVATAPLPASAEQRAAIERLDPLTRSVFWNRERDINPADPVAGVRLAASLRELGQYEQAADAAQAVLTVQPNNLEALLEFGRDQISRGQGFYGIAALEKARALTPGDWRALSLLGVAYNQVRRAEDARAVWNEGLQLSADNPEILTNAAVALMTDGNLPGAEALLRRAVIQPGATTRMRLNLALVLGLQGKTPEAEQIIRRDLPPEQADRNLQWLRDKSAPQATPASLPAGSATARTWNSLQGQ
ncbi:tetratricopeptide repeat protein [Brevundimonas goettingensis]|uniref:Tetratricopeptide repeat protein n=1 Tax=Brevundimonas goettingensis TaxID=2774190 RepID=A0A975C158_9CAUL|nr:tetratricopeptide repeat protein [Brevundimonas goettingensis]QTC90529.1 tetratricopeptide repeat protein [Brevundimonas goettingensis]